MKKVKCRNGHFFDADRFTTCPSCGAEPVGQVTTPIGGRPIEQTPSTQPLMPPADIDIPSESATFASKAGTQPPQEEKSLHFNTSLHQNTPLPDEEPASKSNVHTAERPTLTAAVEATASKNVSPLPKTTAYYDVGEVEPPVGWLICVRGVYIGCAFTCKAGRNRIGRNLDMDICLSEDTSISRDTHAIIIYEPKKRTFYLQAGTGSGLTYHNENLIFDHEEIHAYDKIELGKAEFIFFPLCGEKFTWDDYMTKD